MNLKKLAKKITARYWKAYLNSPYKRPAEQILSVLQTGNEPSKTVFMFTDAFLRELDKGTFPEYQTINKGESETIAWEESNNYDQYIEHFARSQPGVLRRDFPSRNDFFFVLRSALSKRETIKNASMFRSPTRYRSFPSRYNESPKPKKERKVMQEFMEPLTPEYQEARENVSALAIIAFLKGNEWAKEFFSSLQQRLNSTSYTYESLDHTDVGYDYLKDTYGPQNVYRYLDSMYFVNKHIHRKRMTPKQESLYQRYLKDWKDLVTIVRKKHPNLNEQFERGQLSVEGSGRGIDPTLLNTSVPVVVPSPAAPSNPTETALDEGISKAIEKGDKWIKDFFTSILRQVRQGRNLSEKQLVTIRKSFYKLGMRSEADLFR